MSLPSPDSYVRSSLPRLAVLAALLLGLAVYTLLSNRRAPRPTEAVTPGLDLDSRGGQNPTDDSLPRASASGSASGSAGTGAPTTGVSSAQALPSSGSRPKGAGVQAGDETRENMNSARPKGSVDTFGKTGDRVRDAQIRVVVASMDASGKPPDGVAQGGHPPGAFRNREGRLPRGGTYIESDIWPRGSGGRGVERLIFGQERKVWFTGDHYETFSRLR